MPAKSDKTNCCVPQCRSTRYSVSDFHLFPKEPEMKRKWESILKLGKRASEFVKVCGLHFTPRDYFPRREGAKLHFLFPQAVPSQNLPRVTVERQQKKGAQFADVPCSAPDCFNTEKMRFNLFPFPKKKALRDVWSEACLRVGTMKAEGPDSPLRLCEAHFSSEQFLKKKPKCLKAEAIPTIFNPTIKDEHTSDQRSPSPEYNHVDLLDTNESQFPASSLIETPSPRSANGELSTDDLLQISHLSKQLEKMKRMLKSFLTDEQIHALSALYDEDVEENSLWDSESIDQGLKFQFNLGTHGYNFLRSTNYPLPAVETLKSKLGDIVINFGVFEDLSDLIEYKVQSLDPLDRLCTISLDEMKFSDFTSMTQKKQHLISGKFFEDGTEAAGNYITVVMVKGLRSSWEQVIACDSTTSDVDGMSQTMLLKKSISFAEDCGLRVLSFSSSLTFNSRRMWKEFGVDVTKKKADRVAHFKFNDHSIHVVPDVCHLLKSLKAAVDSGIHLSQSLVDKEALPCSLVSSKYLKKLMNSETGKKSSRLLNLLDNDAASDNDEVSLASAVQFFSAKTATALESAVSSKTISPNALSTAYFCRLVDQWFSICDSKSLHNGITVDNKQSKFEFLERFIDIIRGVQIYNGWSPINDAIMSTMSLCEVTNILLQQEGFGVVVLHRFSQEGVENVISQMFERSGSSSTQFSVQSLEILKTITIDQLVSDVDRSFRTTPNTNRLQTNIQNSGSPRATDHKKPQKLSRKVLGKVKVSGTASKPQKRKRAEIESSSKKRSVVKSSKTGTFKSRMQKRESTTGTMTSRSVLSRPKRKFISKAKNLDFVYD